jgi:hypothetical protein
VTTVHAESLSEAIRLGRDDVESLVGPTDAMDWRLDRYEHQATGAALDDDMAARYGGDVSEEAERSYERSRLYGGTDD